MPHRIPRPRRRVLAAAILAVACVALPAGAARKPARIAFSAPVTVAADGSVQVGEVEGTQGRLAAIVRDAIAAFRYVPARGAGGAPMASTVLVDGEVAFRRAGDEYDVVLERFETQPRLLRWRPADYPVDRLRDKDAGTASLVLQVDADGRVAGSRVVSARHADFAAAAQAAADGWRFEPPGQPIEVGAAFWFHGNWAYPRAPEIPCPVPAARLAHLPGDDGCLRTTETTGDVVIWGSGGPYTDYAVRAPAPPSVGGRRYVPED